MENFTAYNPTLLHFGKNVCQKLPETLNQYGKRILMIYGKGSVIKNGIYDKVKGILKETGFEITEYSGIKPIPIIEDVEKAVSIGINEN
jgi:alcohol dehydrogenase YqhD (iron-dependent ADH family)